jgi:iron complex transport system permease protein
VRGFIILGLGLVLAVVFSLMIGDVWITPAKLWQGLLTGQGPGSLTLRVIRGPRVATALGAGAALGLAGAIFQTLFRNPLAAPDVMGFNAGAGLAVLLAISFGWALPMPVVAALGGLLAAVLVAALAHKPGHSASGMVLILVGLGFGFTASAIASFISVSLPVSEASEAQRWLTGSLAARNWGHAAEVWILATVLSIALAALLPAFKLIELGNDLATGLGLRVDAARWSIIAVGVLLATAAVAVSGPVPFVALMAAPLGIGLTRAREPGARFAAAALSGALVMVLADLAARAAIPGVQLPIGVMTGILGAPYLLWRLSREMERGEL